MGNVFGGSEIVELGIQIEKNGKAFYDALAGQSKNDKAKTIFTFLSGEEEKHISAFEKILTSVQKYEPPEAYPGEYFAYMKAMAGDYIFTQKDKGAQAAKKTKSDKEAVGVGIDFEKNSILFYTEMKKVVPEYDRKTIDALISQEQEHLKKLTDLKKAL